VPYPDDGNFYEWNEEVQGWNQVGWMIETHWYIFYLR
jgi:hypothetical protein